MALYEFELLPVEQITPWGEPGNFSLSWFALTLGVFRMRADDQVLFRYTDQIREHWGGTFQDADYQLAAFVREMLGSVPSAMAPLPPLIERLASDWELLTLLVNSSDGAQSDRSYSAWRWLGERSPWTSYLAEYPRLSFLRVGDQVRVCWDNTQRSVDGISVWTAQRGVHAMTVEDFLSESRSFASRLCDAMALRIDQIEAGTARAQIVLDVASLRRQHEEMREEFESALNREYIPDIPWDEAETALREEAAALGIRLPG